jgi:NitT/TauT family transport system permease protein
MWTVVSWSSNSIVIPKVGPFFRHAPGALAQMLHYHLIPTMVRVVAAYVLGTAAGLLVASLMYVARPAEIVVEPWVDFCRSLPSAVVFPFFLAYFGIGQVSVTLPSAWVVFWITVFSTHRELKDAASKRLAYLRRHGAHRWFIMRHLHLYALAKSIFGNARVCVSVALGVLIAMEMLAWSEPGIGAFVKMQQESNRFEEMSLGIAVAGILGYCLNMPLQYLERRLVRW